MGSNRRLASENHRTLRRQHPAVAVRDRGLAIGHLAVAAFAAQLSCRLDQQKQSVHARVAIGEATAIGVDGETAVRGDMAARYERATLALPTKAEILQKQDRVDREGVVQLEDVDIAGAEARHVVCRTPGCQSPGYR